MLDIATAGVLAVGLGLPGFVAPCSVGSHLLFIRYVERRPRREQVLQTVLFAVARAALMAGLGVLAALLGGAFAGLQHGLWAVLGVLYILLGAVYLGGGASRVIAGASHLMPRFSSTQESVGLGLLFGLNVPACAGPLLAVLLGDTVARAAAGGGIVFGATTVLVFGLALSSPLILAVLTVRGRRLLDGVARLAGRMPRWTGVVLVALGGWAILLATS